MTDAKNKTESQTHGAEADPMSPPFLKDFADMLTSMAGLGVGMKKEVEMMFQERAEHFFNKWQFVQRDEFDALKDLVIRLQEEVEAMNAAKKGSKKSAE